MFNALTNKIYIKIERDEKKTTIFNSISRIKELRLSPNRICGVFRLAFERSRRRLRSPRFSRYPHPLFHRLGENFSSRREKRFSPPFAAHYALSLSLFLHKPAPVVSFAEISPRFSGRKLFTARTCERCTFSFVGHRSSYYASFARWRRESSLFPSCMRRVVLGIR